jgi:hypothetical protein
MGRLGVGAYVSVRDLVTTLGYGGWRGTVMAEHRDQRPHTYRVMFPTHEWTRRWFRADELEVIYGAQ